MKNLILYILLLSSCVPQAQNVQFIGTKDNTIQVRKALTVDSIITLPKDTLASAPNGSLAYKNSCLLIRINNVWRNAYCNTFLIATQPQSLSVNEGASTTLSVAATGGTAPYTYQWQKNGANLSGANAVSFIISSSILSDAGSYRVLVTDATGTLLTSNVATLTVNATALAISTQPQPITVLPGSSFTFTSSAIGGVLPYTWQWFKGGSAISGATSSSYTKSAISGDAGTYFARVTDAASTVATSGSAVLTVSTSTLAVNALPATTTISTGSNVTFTITASAGTAPYTYQWKKGGTNISGATSASYTITGAVTGDAGDYTVTVTDAASGSVTSNTATLVVTAAIAFTYGYSTEDPYDPTGAPGGGAQFTLTNSFNGTVAHNADISVTFIAAANNKYLWFKVPNSESTKLSWFSNPGNNGTLGDAVFRSPIVLGAFTYYVSRSVSGVAFDTSIPFKLTNP